MVLQLIPPSEKVPKTQEMIIMVIRGWLIRGLLIRGLENMLTMLNMLIPGEQVGQSTKNDIINISLVLATFNPRIAPPTPQKKQGKG